MTLSLSEKDQAHIAAATQALVSPFAHASVLDWLRSVTATTKELLRADKASIMFPTDTGEVLTAGFGFDPSVLVDYTRERLPQQERQWGTVRQSVALGAWNRRLLYGNQLSDMYRSQYYNEYLVPKGAFDAIGLTVPLEAPGQVVNLYFHHDRPTGPRFGSRGLALLRLMYPAFAAGVRAARTLLAQRQALQRFSDTVQTGVSFWDGDRREIYRNTALISMSLTDPEWATVERHFPSMLKAVRAERSHAGAAEMLAFRRIVRTAVARYQMSVTLLDHCHRPGDASIAIITERSAPPEFPAEALRSRYGLTSREIDVTRLLCEGATNDRIAQSLSISTSTARHHTERIMSKLAVHTRAQIPSAVRRCADGDVAPT